MVSPYCQKHEVMFRFHYSFQFEYHTISHYNRFYLFFTWLKRKFGTIASFDAHQMNWVWKTEKCEIEYRQTNYCENVDALTLMDLSLVSDCFYLSDLSFMGKTVYYWSQRVFQLNINKNIIAEGWSIQEKEKASQFKRFHILCVFLLEIERMRTKWNEEIRLQNEVKRIYFAFEQFVFRLLSWCVYTFHFRFVSISIFAESWRVYTGLYSFGWHTIERY